MVHTNFLYAICARTPSPLRCTSHVMLPQTKHESAHTPFLGCLVCLQALTLDRDAFHALLGRLDSLRSMWRFEALQRVPLFARLDHKTKAAVAAALGQVNMPKGTAVVTQVSGLLRALMEKLLWCAGPFGSGFPVWFGGNLVARGWLGCHQVGWEGGQASPALGAWW